MVAVSSHLHVIAVLSDFFAERKRRAFEAEHSHPGVRYEPHPTHFGIYCERAGMRHQDRIFRFIGGSSGDFPSALQTKEWQGSLVIVRRLPRQVAGKIFSHHAEFGHIAFAQARTCVDGRGAWITQAYYPLKQLADVRRRALGSLFEVCAVHVLAAEFPEARIRTSELRKKARNNQLLRLGIVPNQEYPAAEWMRLHAAALKERLAVARTDSPVPAPDLDGL